MLDNTDEAFLGAGVAPDQHRRGIGGAILRQLIDLGSQRGRTVFLAESNIPGTDRTTHPYVRFATRHGFDLANVEVRRELRCPSRARSSTPGRSGPAHTTRATGSRR